MINNDDRSGDRAFEQNCLSLFRPIYMAESGEIVLLLPKMERKIKLSSHEYRDQRGYKGWRSIILPGAGDGKSTTGGNWLAVVKGQDAAGSGEARTTMSGLCPAIA